MSLTASIVQSNSMSAAPVSLRTGEVLERLA
jgi:hypothetical protein